MNELPIANGFYTSYSLPLSHQECVNFYVHAASVPALSQKQLFGTAGIVYKATTGEIKQANRGAHVKNGIPYFVNGSVLYSMDEEHLLTALGTIAGEGRVSMADNGKQLMVLVPGGAGYVYDETATPAFTIITDTDFEANGAPQIVKYIDGYFAVTTDSKKWIVSALNNALSWDALDFASAESDPDDIVAPVVVNNQLYIVGATTTEGVQNIGGAGFPFQRNYVFLDKGCAAPGTLIAANSAFFMVGGGEREGVAIWKFQGNSFERISTDSIDLVLQQYTVEQLQGSFAWSYAQKGAYFVGFTFADRTFVFDMATLTWHERKSTYLEEQTRWRVGAIVAAYEQTFVGDLIDGRIGALDVNAYTEYGINIVRQFSTQPFAEAGAPVTSTILELTMESGAGTQETPNPQVSLALSSNGKTFGPERVRSVGPLGEYDRRIVWRKNGRYSRFAVLSFRLSDAIKPVVIKLEFE